MSRTLTWVVSLETLSVWLLDVKHTLYLTRMSLPDFFHILTSYMECNLASTENKKQDLDVC